MTQLLYSVLALSNYASLALHSGLLLLHVSSWSAHSCADVTPTMVTLENSQDHSRLRRLSDGLPPRLCLAKRSMSVVLSPIDFPSPPALIISPPRTAERNVLAGSKCPRDLCPFYTRFFALSIRRAVPMEAARSQETQPVLWSLFFFLHFNVFFLPPLLTDEMNCRSWGRVTRPQ